MQVIKEMHLIGSLRGEAAVADGAAALSTAVLADGVKAGALEQLEANRGHRLARYRRHRATQFDPCSCRGLTQAQGRAHEREKMRSPAALQDAGQPPGNR